MPLSNKRKQPRQKNHSDSPTPKTAKDFFPHSCAVQEDAAPKELLKERSEELVEQRAEKVELLEERVEDVVEGLLEEVIGELVDELLDGVTDGSMQSTYL